MPLIVVMDESTMRRDGGDLKSYALEALRKDGWQVRVCSLPADESGQVHTDMPHIQMVQGNLSPGCAVLSIGSGVVTDIAKHGCFLYQQETGEKIPFVVYQTANSVSAYTSNMSPTFVDGVKRTLDSRYPDALIVHRLDFNTSGLLVLALGKDMHRRLSILFQDRLVDKRYVAVVDGKLAQDSGQIDLPLIVDWPNRPLHKVDFETGKPSQTVYKVLDYDANKDCSRVELTPLTGRTHQLRVHMKAIGHTILGDPLYADATTKAKADRLLLHAEYLAFRHPVTSDALSFTCAPDF